MEDPWHMRKRKGARGWQVQKRYGSHQIQFLDLHSSTLSNPLSNPSLITGELMRIQRSHIAASVCQNKFSLFLFLSCWMLFLSLAIFIFFYGESHHHWCCIVQSFCHTGWHSAKKITFPFICGANAFSFFSIFLSWRYSCSFFLRVWSCIAHSFCHIVPSPPLCHSVHEYFSFSIICNLSEFQK